MAIDLPLLWAAIIGVGVYMYVLMDGFDLGVGILFPSGADETERDIMMNSVAPIWDGNETWLVLGGTGLLAAFPLAYSIILPALYFPILIMLVALIFRGVAFEFRFKADHRTKHWWDYSFTFGSILATFSQGLVLGGFIQGFQVEGRDFTGGTFDWLTPFSVFVGIALVVGYALLGATWLIMKTEGELQARCYGMARVLVLAMLFCIFVVSIWTPLLNEEIAQRWFTWPNIALLSPVPIITALLAIVLVLSLHGRREVAPFVLSMGLFLLCYLGLGISLWPYVIPPDISIWDAASPSETQTFVLIGVLILLPAILFYTFYVYYVFRGKVTKDVGYH
ncbi:cytochrome d ubiquinol oxidase subunit II [Alkalilimnicola ehrlichii]|uniref:Cytochrome d ubiquinol oxidase subunit II n=1 Tax=Alkalilimnicola ehrlichii TaxID=351052 RepID=A0A3E0WHU9_9GAMM|nr:cytochrome d ubiquinol oxidase subunit II [Alkalilimnicola ehrlichii]RFA26156.1 cytochrome d ubiquinol oxidase subunit II [Alkalilimnicola ehrlichii]RFA32348.1 cytochrome d ubiquinol oxidase subunit II [Alkalilimnicola ehrlichii]